MMNGFDMMTATEHLRRELDLRYDGIVMAPRFSFFKRPVMNTKPYKDITLADAYAYITGCYAMTCTAQLRQISDAKARRTYKATHFDHCTFAGTFTRRAEDGLIKPSGLLCADMDHLPDVERSFDLLIDDDVIDLMLLFRSPSGDGLKAVIAIDLSEAPFADYFTAMRQYMQKAYGIGIDTSCKDICRTCFLPYDPNAYINPSMIISHEK